MSPLRIGAFASAGLLVAVLAAETSLADEAYVCDGGRLVYVKPGELEHLKRTDPCIAGYYGLEIGKAPGAGEPAAAKAGSENVRKDVPEGGAQAGLALEREARAQIKPALPAVSSSAAHQAKKTALAAPADFRNVVIINATSGADAIFRHDR